MRAREFCVPLWIGFLLQAKLGPVRFSAISPRTCSKLFRFPRFKASFSQSGCRRPRLWRPILASVSLGATLSGLLGCTAQIGNIANATANSPSIPTGPPNSSSGSNSLPIIPLPQEQAAASGSFVSSVGVVTHLSYTNTPYYTQFPQILSALQSLGVRHIRDGYYPWGESNPVVQEQQKLAANGITCDYVVPYDLTTTPQAIEQFASMVGNVESLEPPNECDISGACNGLGATAIENLIGFLPTVNTAAQALGVPVLGPAFVNQDSYTEAGDLSSQMNVNNLHIYFGGRNPGSAGWGAEDAEGNSYGSFAWWLDQAAIDGPGLPSEITETGYIASQSTSTPFTLPDSVEASYAPRTLLLAYKNGFKETFLYELLDEVSSPGYGLLNSDLSPKPAFTAVENLLSTLSDQGASQAASFTPGSLPYTLSGGDQNLNHLLLEKSDGTYWLVLWLEEPSWDPVNVAALAVQPENITLELDGADTATTAYQFDDSGNVTTVPLTMDQYDTSLTVSDQVTIVKITPQ
jgi:hypothetical protein